MTIFKIDPKLKSLLFLAVIGLFIVSSVLVVNYFLLAWTEPTAAPPNGSGSLNVSRYSLNAHDGNPTDALYVDDNGNVGIGTNNPSQKLDVDGSMNVRGNSIHMSNSNTNFYGDSTNAAVRMDGQFYVQDSGGTSWKNVGANDYYINKIGRWASSIGNSNICYCIQCHNTYGTWDTQKCTSFGNWTGVSGAPLTGVDDVSYCRIRLYPCS